MAVPLAHPSGAVPSTADGFDLAEGESPPPATAISTPSTSNTATPPSTDNVTINDRRESTSTFSNGSLTLMEHLG